MVPRVRDLLEMIRFSHTLFALPFALLAAVMAWRVPTAAGDAVAFRWQDLLGIFLCMVFARSTAMAVNRLADRVLDAANPRTSGRHLPSGRLSVASVRVFAVVAGLLFVAATLLFWPNRLPLVFALPTLAFLCGYSYAKRFTTWSHFWLGAALMLAPLAAWIALRGAVVMQSPLDMLPAIILGLAVLLWVAGFDIIYACQDAAFDTSAGLHSVPARFGVATALRLAAMCHLAMLVALSLLPFAGHFGGPPLMLGWIYGCSLAAVAILLLYEHMLVRPDDLTRVNRAFFQVNAVISFGLFVVVSLDLFW